MSYPIRSVDFLDKEDPLIYTKKKLTAELRRILQQVECGQVVSFAIALEFSVGNMGQNIICTPSARENTYFDLLGSVKSIELQLLEKLEQEKKRKEALGKKLIELEKEEDDEESLEKEYTLENLHRLRRMIAHAIKAREKEDE